MANFSFAKYSRRERVKFFQSSLPYLQSNALIVSSSGKTKKWFLEEPHRTDLSFLTFKKGHYGIYFTLFNHELRKKEHDTPRFDSNNVIFVVQETPSPKGLSEFCISKAKQDTHNDIDWLKTVSKNLLLKLRYSFRQLYHTRPFLSSASKARDTPPDRQTESKLENIPKATSEEPASHAETSPAAFELVADPVPFEESLLDTQVAQIAKAFETHASPDDLNVIYPLYQSLKRNNILLPSIEEYNTVLKSISLRSLDGDATLRATEARLTTLLTIYQDILSACKIKSSCHPNTETYHIVLGSVFRCSKQLLTLPSANELPLHNHQHLVSKCLEFCQVGVDLYTSSPDEAKTVAREILPDMLYCLNFFPELLSTDLAALLAQHTNDTLSVAGFYVNLILLVKYLCRPENLGLDPKQSYDFVNCVFSNYKNQCQIIPHLSDAEYGVYSSMLKALVASGNTNIATKFLDEVMLSYKDGLLMMKVGKTSVADLSGLISDYLEALMSLGSVKHLDEAYSLMKTMREVSYIPETNSIIYNDMICRYITLYVNQDIPKAVLKNIDEVQRLQETTYRKIWALYNYVAIRKDFAGVVSFKSTRSSCIEMLLSLSIDLGDLPNVSRLTKEILLKNVYVRDWNVSKKLCSVLSSNSFTGGSHLYEVMWAFLDLQAGHLGDDALQLNDFLSEHLPYLIVDNLKVFLLIMNLTLVHDAFEKCNLQTTNLYGANFLMKYLIRKSKNSVLTEAEKAKVLAYQAFLINEFEDTENFYLELPADLLDLRTMLKRSFLELYLSIHDTRFLTAAVLQACLALGLPIDSVEHQNIALVLYERNLIPYMNVSSQMGIEMFIEQFKKGYNFTHDTWQAIINRSFVMDILEPAKSISVLEFVQGMMKIEDRTLITSLLSSLVSLHNDKVNIMVFKYLVADKADWVFESNELMSRLTTFAQQTQNQYFVTLFCKSFVELARINSRRTWMAKVLEKLNETERHAEIYSIVSQNFDFLNKGLDISVKSDELFLKNVLMAYMKVGKEDEVNDIFNFHFSGPNQKKLLVSSNELLSCLLEYYTTVGSHNMVAQKFAGFANRDTHIKQSIQFTNLLLSLKGSQIVDTCSHDKNANSLALSLLMENNLLKMKKLYESNEQLIRDREQFFNTLIKGLTKAANSLDPQFLDKVVAKFEAIIKLCKVIRLKRISADTLSNVVDFLVVSGSNSLLNILFSKFLVNNTLVSSFKFYFLEVELLSKCELTSILEKFETGFRMNGDLINLHVVADFKSQA